MIASLELFFYQGAVECLLESLDQYDVSICLGLTS